MMCILAISKVSRFKLVSVAEQAGLNLTWSKISEDTFSRNVAQLFFSFFFFLVISVPQPHLPSWSDIIESSIDRKQERVIEPPHDKTNKMACAPSKDSDQTGRIPRLI